MAMVVKCRRPFLIICICLGFTFVFLFQTQPLPPPATGIEVVVLGNTQRSLLEEINQRLSFLENKLRDADDTGVKLGLTMEEIQLLRNQFAAQPSFDVGVPEGGLNPSPEPVEGQRSTRVVQGGKTTTEETIGVLVLACNRPTVTKCLDKLLEYRPSSTKFPIVLSQDCGKNATVLEALRPYESKLSGHIYQPDLSAKDDGYQKIARHYRWALKQAFETFNYRNLIVVEDDLEVAPDFFEYFAATLPILQADPTLYCVSAWNDNGKVDRVDLTVPEKLYRTDFFPGLGWMLTRTLWDELGPKWDPPYWDDWIRRPPQRKGRACIRPEISRTFTFGKVGVSDGMYYDAHLKLIKLNEEFVEFTKMDLSYLIKENYDPEFFTLVKSASVVKSVTELKSKVNSSLKPTRDEYRIEYKDEKDFKKYALQLKIMEDFWFHVPRMGYYGIVSTFVFGCRLYLVPSSFINESDL